MRARARARAQSTHVVNCENNNLEFHTNIEIENVTFGDVRTSLFYKLIVFKLRLKDHGLSVFTIISKYFGYPR